MLGLVYAAVILGVIGLVRAFAEFGLPGLIAYAKLAVVPAVIMGAFTLQWPAWRLPSDSVWKGIFVTVAVLTGAAFAISAGVGVGWLVPK